MQQLQELVATKDWDAALNMGRQLAENFTLKEDRRKIAKPLADLLREALESPLARQQDKVREVRQKLAEVEMQLPNDESIRAVSASLKRKAELLLVEANRAVDINKDYAKAQDLLALAEDYYPQLPGLRELRQKITQTYPILRIGVRSLAVSQEQKLRLSPAWATTDTELRAVELLFESLIKVSPDADGGERFLPGLALGRPQIVPRGRLVQLPRAWWSNSKPLTSADVQSSIALLKEGATPGLALGRAPAWGDLLDRDAPAHDPFRIHVNFQQGYVEPLSLMTFKIVPERAKIGKSPATLDFAHDPVGSGPFTFAGVKSDGGRTQAVFLANPMYGLRSNKRNLPGIREVRLIQYVNPIEDWKDPQLGLHVLLDLTADKAHQLRQRGRELNLTMPAPLPGNRRVYFLAVNHGTRQLQDAKVRRGAGPGH